MTDYTQTLTVRPDYGTFVICVKGADPLATIDLQFSVAYSVIPSKSAQNFIRGVVPSVAPYTDFFMEYLRGAYPDLYCWPQEEIQKFYHALKALPQTYSALTKYCHPFKPKPRRPVSFAIDREDEEYQHVQ